MNTFRMTKPALLAALGALLPGTTAVFVLVAAYADPARVPAWLLVVAGVLVSIAGDELVAAWEHARGRPMLPEDAATVVTICGSTRFVKDQAVAATHLTLEGAMVLRPEVVTSGEPIADTEVKTRLDRLHKDKIRFANYVLVVAPGGYVGPSTAEEVRYALALNRPVRFYDPNTTGPLALLPTEADEWVRPVDREHAATAPLVGGAL